MDKQAEAAARLNETLFNQVYYPHFKQACAKRGIEFDNQEDLIAGLETVAMLKEAEAALRAQGVDPRPSAKKQARDLLKQAMYGETQSAETELSGVKQALADLISASTAQEESAKAQ